MKITLDSPLSTLSRISPDHEAGLKKLNISNILELLHHFPVRYADMREISGTSTLVAGQPFTVYGVMEKVSVRRSFKGHMPMTEARVADNTGTIRCVWFNQAYIGKMYPDGTKVKISGVVHEDKKGFLLSNPNIERAEGVIPESQESLFAPNADTNFLTPVYRETKGVSSLYIYTLIKKAVQANVLDDIVDPIPLHVLKKLHLPELRDALLYIHFPKNETLTIAARKRFAFEEIFSLQLKQYQEKVEAKHSLAYPIKVDKVGIKKFIDSFPFKPTTAQMDAINSILKDLSRKEPMGRLLEGDVGSGKTFVAATVTYAVFQNSAEKNGPSDALRTGRPLQIAYMAPTEILAKQHFESFIKYFEGTGIEIGLLTGSGCAKFPSKSDYSTSTPISRTQLLSWLADGRVSIVIGTHALIQKSVSFQNLALIIIDEQHRFGVRQRKALARRNNAEDSGTDAEKIPTDNLLYRDLTYKIREAIFTVKKELGSGHKEVVYQRSLAEEFTKRKINFDREKQIPIFYNKKKVGIYQPDFVVENSVIVELKTIPRITAIEKKQLWNYLKGSEYKLGLLVNFGHIELEIERVIYDTARSLSASVPQHSASLPHLLSMTATPIPRTLALTIFGDLDLTVIDSMPLERKKIITEIVPARGRTETYEKIRKELQAGRQVYVICPRIDEQDEEERQKRILKSVKEEAQRLADVIFPEFIVDILHSKMKKEEKEEVMQDFLDKKSDILVATSVIEVGINVPNATVIIIEHADRFGLAQLHQLRGRVGRREYQSYCYLFTESEGEITQKRLKALVNAKNGFELAEQDMLARGIGALMDGKQWGISDLAMEAIKNPKLVEIARDEARELLDNDPTLEKYPELAEIIRKRTQVHME